MKSQFRTNIEQAVKNARMSSLLNARHVFLDRNKCSDRIKFAFTSADNRDITRIHNEVQKMYPNETVTVCNNEARYIGNWSGLSISVSHANNQKL